MKTHKVLNQSLPEFSPNVSAAGTITSVDVINSGRNFLPTQNLSTIISSGSATGPS